MGRASRDIVVPRYWIAYAFRRQCGTFVSGCVFILPANTGISSLAWYAMITISSILSSLQDFPSQYWSVHDICASKSGSRA